MNNAPKDKGTIPGTPASTEASEATTLTSAALVQCLQVLQDLAQDVDIVEENKEAYAVFQAAQKLYKNVKKNRKYIRKTEAPPPPEFDRTSVRFDFLAPTESAVSTESPNAQDPQNDPEAFDNGREIMEPPPAKARRGKCYICQRRAGTFHRTYDSMCVPCGDFNLEKRLQASDLSGQVALVTGARVKIGYQVGLKLLRSGATLIATTRFPHDAARRYAAEHDFVQWQDRLHIFGLDLRHIPSIHAFTQHLRQTQTRLDILVQNAAQTVRRPPAYFRHLLPLEQQAREALPETLQRILPAPPTPALPTTHAPSTQLAAPEAAGEEQRDTALVHLSSPGTWASPATTSATNTTLPLSAMLSQVPLLPNDAMEDPTLFPPDAYDEDEQQEDRRPDNSWTMNIEDVPGAELWEVHTINAIAPFLLLQGLTPLLQHPHATHKHVIHVAAAEGQFHVGGSKPSRHPHTNMSKAALNMLTRTCAGRYARQNIYINSVDPGWVSYEMPQRYVLLHAKQGFKLPLDAVDGAARILDPVFAAGVEEMPLYGKLLKDFGEVPW